MITCKFSFRYLKLFTNVTLLTNENILILVAKHCEIYFKQFISVLLVFFINRSVYDKRERTQGCFSLYHVFLKCACFSSTNSLAIEHCWCL